MLTVGERLEKLTKGCPDGRPCQSHVCVGKGCFRKELEKEGFTIRNGQVVSLRSTD